MFKDDDICRLEAGDLIDAFLESLEKDLNSDLMLDETEEERTEALSWVLDVEICLSISLPYSEGFLAAVPLFDSVQPIFNLNDQ